MSEDRANLDVEDVLSSIRRLVTQDGRTPRSGEESPGALVLTPAYRVSETDDAPSAAREDTPPVPSAPESLVDTIIELEAAVSGIEATFEPDTGEASDPVAMPAPFDEPFAIDSDAEQDTVGAADDAADAPDETGAGDGADQDAAQPDADADVDENVDAAQQDADADVEEDAGVALPDSDSVVEAAAPSADAQAGTADCAEPDQAPRAGPFDDAAPEPEGGPAASPDAALQPDVEGPQPQAPVTLPAGMAAPSIDPVMLRLLVSAIVREELQGSLGEKLTDRIRQLVRREIEIAMRDRPRQ